MGIMNARQQNLAAQIKKKKECDKRAQEIVLKLIEPQVDQTYLLSQAVYIGPPHFEDVVEERRLGGMCGWTLCNNSLDPTLLAKKQRYVIRGSKVLDITDRKAFCSSACYAKSTHFKRQLPISPLWLREDEEKEEETTFELLEDDTTQLHGLVVNVTGLKLTDEDKEKDSPGEEEDSDNGSDEETDDKAS